jgi:UDP-N-acetylmuramyl pentapeptide synthase
MNWNVIFKLILGKKIGNWDGDLSKPLTFTNTSKSLVNNGVFIVNGKSLDYIEEAQKNGVNFIVMDPSIDQNIINKINLPIFQVDDLDDFFKAIRTFQMKNAILKIGITGSAGKTTTTRNLAFFLSKYYTVSTNMRNYNTPIGINLTIASQDENTEIFIYEMGISVPGDMGALTNVFKPDVCIILPVKHGHSSNFHILQDLINEKLSIITNDTKFCITLREYQKFVKYKWPSINFIALEDLYPDEWVQGQWNREEVYNQLINNIGNYILYNCL